MYSFHQPKIALMHFSLKRGERDFNMQSQLSEEESMYGPINLTEFTQLH